MTEHLGYEKNRAPGGRDSSNVRNGARPKPVLTHATGQVELEVPRDREGTFEPTSRSDKAGSGEVDEIVLSLYARSPTAGEISAHFEQTYGASVSKETVARITDKVLEELQTWSTRPLNEVYAAIPIDAIMVKVRNGQVANRPIYAAIGVSLTGERTSWACGPALVCRPAVGQGDRERFERWLPRHDPSCAARRAPDRHPIRCCADVALAGGFTGGA